MNTLLKFLTCGSVDDGKSTLIGHLLYDAKLLYADQEKALLLDSKVGSRGGEVDYSLLLDGLMAEREQGITIDVAYRYFTTDKRSFIVADTPGHEEYTRNMAVGASFADLAVILVDASKGVLVQTRRHARICKLVGIRHFVFAVNKMDLAGYEEKRFREIQGEIDALAEELALRNYFVIPVSATEGDNVTRRSENMPWFHSDEGDTLLSYLENIDIAEESAQHGFYMPVQRVCRPDSGFRGFQGQIESGSISLGESVVSLPNNETATVKKIYVGDKSVTQVGEGQYATIQLSKEIDVSRGSVLSSRTDLTATGSVKAQLLWMDDGSLSPGREYLLKLATSKVPAIIKRIYYKIDVNTGEKISADSVSKNEIAYCGLELAEKIIADTFDRSKTLGGFILIDRVSHATSACGVIEEIQKEEEKYYFENGDIRVSGCIFEEFYFNLEHSFVSEQKTNDKQYKVGDQVPVEGESFRYPDYFDIISVSGNAAVLIRNRIVEDMIPLDDYEYTGLPVLDTRGFALRVHSMADLQNFLYESRRSGPGRQAELYNKWAKFETYRRIVCTDNFWMI